MIDIKQLLNQQRFRFAKQLGQNFLTDDKILEEIVESSGISNLDTILEIGAGAGTLTQKLAQKAKKVIAFEIDKRLKPILDITVGDQKNVEVIFADIMKYEISDIEKLVQNQPFKVVANIPYYITTPLILNFVENSEKIQSMTLTIQLEVAKRISAQPNSKDFGALTVAVQSVADASIALVLDKSKFTPVPNVDSAVININFNRKKFDIADQKMFRKTTKSAFAMRRKTLANNLSNDFDLTKTQAQDLLQSLNLNPQIRGEALSIQNFVDLANKLSKHSE